MAERLNAVAESALGNQMGAVVNDVGGSGGAGRLPEAPDGYITVNIPGVGPRLIPYYPV
jgi:hypothetical protein